MDEILIEEKKYVSSKRAAKVTGYAKDYIGQLCREGRVPARLVGRNWYVLESAINDHRFGKQEMEQEIRPAPTWESARYEALSDEIFPSVNRLSEENEKNGQNEASQFLQDSWKAWFDRVADSKSEPISSAPFAIPEKEEKRPEINEEIKEIKEEEISIPVHTIYELPPENLLPRHRLEIVPSNQDEQQQEGEGEGEGTEQEQGRGKTMIVQIAGAIVAALIAVIAIAGTGYFDKYILSSSQVDFLAGVSFYNK
jgi:hypothetical protein